MNVVDLFAGVGGFSNGFEKAGFKVVLANEIDSDISESYKLNHKKTLMINDDIRNLATHIDEYISNEIDVIIGGPPCQGFSMAGARIRKTHSFLDDPRNYLFRYYFKIVQRLEPNFFVMENVPGMLSMQNGDIIKEIESLFTDKTNFKDNCYNIYKVILNAKDFGVPQDRKRLIIFGTKFDIDIEEFFIRTKIQMENNKEIENVMICDAISDLNFLNSGEGRFESNYILPPITKYQIERRKNSQILYNHKATNHNKTAINRMMELKPGDRRVDLTDAEQIKSVHSGAYGRMKWNEIAKTIITRFDTPSSGVYVHPELNRTITPREAARLQSFDDDFIFYGNKSSIIKQIGNAVPPLLAKYLANVIINIQEFINENI